MRSIIKWTICLLSIGAAACGGRRTSAPAFQDTHPLPEEPMVVRTASVGSYGGRFVIAETSGPKTFNAMMANESSSTDITERMFLGLANFDNFTQQDTPYLAKSWEVSPDGLIWTFHLRNGAAFSDGHPITADDVLFSFEVAYDSVAHPSVQDLLIMNGQRWEVTAPDASTIVIKTPSPNAMVVPLASSVKVMPKHVLEGPFKKGDFVSSYNVSTPADSIVTSGPWRVQQYVAGEKTVLTRNPYYFGIDSAKHRIPYLDELVFLIVPDQDAADLKFRAGEVDGVDNVKPENYRWYEDHQKEGNYTLYDLGPALNSNFFWFNLNTVHKPTAGKKMGEPQVDPVKYAWFNNPVFRRAVSLAIDRDAMIPSIFFGDAVKNWSMSTAGSKLWYSPDLVKFDFNLAEARKLIASLGWADRNGDGIVEDGGGHAVSFNIKTNSDNKIRVSLANFIRDDLAKIGVKLNLVPIDFNTLVVNIREDYQYESILLGLQSGVPPDPALSQNVIRSSGRTHYWNIAQPKPETPDEAKMDQLMDVLVSTPDLPKRQAAWKEVENIINQQNWFIWLPTINVKLPVRNRFGNLEPSVIPHRLVWNSETIYVKKSN